MGEAAETELRAVVTIDNLVIAVHQDHVDAIHGVRNGQQREWVAFLEVLRPEVADCTSAVIGRSTMHHQGRVVLLDGGERSTIVLVVRLDPAIGERLHVRCGTRDFVRLVGLIPEIAVQTPVPAVAHPDVRETTGSELTAVLPIDDSIIAMNEHHVRARDGVRDR